MTEDERMAQRKKRFAAMPPPPPPRNSKSPKAQPKLPKMEPGKVDRAGKANLASEKLRRKPMPAKAKPKPKPSKKHKAGSAEPTTKAKTKAKPKPMATAADALKPEDFDRLRPMLDSADALFKECEELLADIGPSEESISIKEGPHISVKQLLEEAGVAIDNPDDIVEPEEVFFW